MKRPTWLVVLCTMSALTACQPAPVQSPREPTVAAPAMGPVAPAPTAPGSPCQFVLGFAQLRTQLGPSTVGECLENEHPVQGTNDVVQRTSTGVLTHRDLDNRNLFSTATQTWLEGPNGLVSRPVDERFDWEGDRELINALRLGGFILYFRHGATDPNQTDSDPNHLENCATQRNLTDAGRAQARAIGDAFQSLGIPVGSVLSSEYCRALEYSRIAFNKAQPESSLDLTDFLTDQEKATNTQSMQRLLATRPMPGANTILVSHSPNIRLAANVDLPVEGEAVIFRVAPSGTSTEVTRVLPTDWPQLAKAVAKH